MKLIRSLVSILFVVGLVSACSLHDNRPVAVLYDLGPVQIQPATYSIPSSPIVSTQVQSLEWLETNLMSYRLNYINAQRISFYTQSSWNMTPAQLLKNRFDEILSRSGATVSNITTDAPTLMVKLELEDFSQHFDSATQSKSKIVVRATLFSQGQLIAQKRFEHEVVAKTADAIGGADAMSECTDAIIGNIVQWMVEK